MIKTIIGSSKSATIPRSAKTVLVVGLFVTVVASFFDKGIAHFVNPAFRLGPSSTRILVISPQLTSNTIRKTFAGWSFVVPSDGNITATMEKALTSSVAIPDAKSDQVYTPVTTDYTIKCIYFSMVFEAKGITEDGCVKLFPGLVSNASYLDYFLTTRSPNRWSILMNSKWEPYNTRIAALSLPFEISKGDECATYESTRLRPFGNIRDGISSFPTTATSKCFLRSGDMAVMSLTSTRFTFANKEYNTNLTSQIFADTSDELLLTMNESFKTKTIPPSNRSVELWVELRAKNSSVDILACAYDSYRLDNNPPVRNVECAYYISNVFVMTQPFNPKIKEAAKLPRAYQSGTFMVLDHVPTTSGKNHAPVSLAKLRNDTAAVSDYMARLGTNSDVDYYEGKFFAEYDVKNIESGLEIPLWVLIVSRFILMASFILWQLTNWIIGSPHTSSLYRIIAKRMVSQTDRPVLLRAKIEPHEPLELEGIVLLPGESIQGTDSMNKS
ncbi:hypothetical protein BGX34_006908 [Mortierella sp. NVP85]|nr:hypothetical protein BGX34_006908 [Mortierella sp. NVP85]